MRKSPTLPDASAQEAWFSSVKGLRPQSPEPRAQLHPATAHLLEYFFYGDLPERVQEIGKAFHELAHQLAGVLQGPEVTVGLRRLLESRDWMVRSAIGAGHGLILGETNHAGLDA
jgi:hypothetical protein